MKCWNGYGWNTLGHSLNKIELQLIKQSKTDSGGHLHVTKKLKTDLNRARITFALDIQYSEVSE